MRKSNFVFLAVFVFFGALCSSVALCADVEWQKESFSYAGNVSDGRSGDGYYLDLPGASCRVNILDDGIVEAVALDYQWQRTATNEGKYVEDVSIIDTKTGKITRHISSSDNASTPPHYANGGGYWVFNAKCTLLTKSLPEKVQEKLRGYLDVK